MDQEETREIRELSERGMAIRAIARKLGRDPKTIRRALGRPQEKPQPPKLEPFKALIEKLAKEELAAPRILRELCAAGYTGGLTLLKDHLKEIRGPRRRPRKAFRRFETRMAQEAQVDWSPYRLKIAGAERVAHCFSMILCYSRRLWIGFYRNERLPTLLYAHVEALRYHQGSSERLVYDNQTTVTLGRVGGAPLWNPSFLEFAKFYGFTPRVTRVGHKERKGKVERPFAWIESDLLRGREFESWEELNASARQWLDAVANVRKHSTTGRKVDEMYAEEKPYLIALPESDFPTERREVRKVGKDGYLAVDGAFYPVPSRLVGQFVSVRIYPGRLEILDAAGQVAAAHAVPAEPRRLPAPPEAPLRSEPALSLTVLQTRFLAHFPAAADFLAGLQRRMKALAPIHLHRIERLVDLYGELQVARAIERAMAYRNFNALAVSRILERTHPNVVAEPPVEPLSASPEVLGALDDVEPGSPRDYTVDQRPASEEAPDGT
jgi:transposase